MEYQIRSYVDELFEGAPNTQRAYEMKVELSDNLIEKYNALIQEGKSEEDAYNITILSIGDVSELFSSLEDTPYVYYDQSQSAKTRSAAMITISVMLYILSFVPVVLFGNSFGVVCMFIFWAAATGLLIFNQLTKPKGDYYGQYNVVSEFKNWQTGNTDRKQLKKAISSALWSIIVVIYILISFNTGKWYITWVIFPMGAAIEGVISALFAMQRK